MSASDTVAHRHEHAVVDDAEHLPGDHLAGWQLVEDRRPGIVPELLYAEEKPSSRQWWLMLRMIASTSSPLLVEVRRVVDLRRPRDVALVDHPVDTLFDADEDAVVRDAPHTPGDLRAWGVLLGED